MSVVDLRFWGYRSWISEATTSHAEGAEVGRVVNVHRGQCDVITEKGFRRAWSDSVRAQSEVAPVTGDWVSLEKGDDADIKVITKVLHRVTTLRRRDPAERESEQVLAANVDIVGIVAGLDRPLPPGRFERLLVMALDSGADILVLLTKADKAKKIDVTVETVEAVVGEDVPVVVVSSLTEYGLDSIRSHLGMGRTLVLVGASGSGKSALVNAMADASVVATGEVRPKDARGRHTTVTRKLVLLSDRAGLILDTPGIRSLGLWDCEEALIRLFGDIKETSSDCRFTDCSHDTEPDCAVQARIERGEISAQRLERARALSLELENQKTRITVRDR